MTSIPTSERFQKNVLDLLDIVMELNQIVYDNGYRYVEPALMEMAGPILKEIPHTHLIETFIDSTYNSEIKSTYWDQIRLKSEVFFLENSDKIFSGLPLGNIKAFKALFTAKDSEGELIISEEDRDCLWSYFSSLVKICINYIHEGREPRLKDGNPRYGKNFYPDVELEQQAKLWKVELKF